MARIKVNNTCNICTGDESKARPSATGEVAPEITIPRYRARLSVHEAKALVQHLQEALAYVELPDRVRLAKVQVLRDVGLGLVPATVASYSELHDHVDANYYGGAFENDAPSVAFVEYWNTLQDEVDKWIKSGEMLANSKVMEVKL